MEKIERLAKLTPHLTGEHELELFKVLRGLVVLDWILRNPNDLGAKKSESKFRGLMEKATEIVGKIQDETEKHESVLVDVEAGDG